jgi:D-tyrosyl-tRNA(Tyr) deacylase
MRAVVQRVSRAAVAVEGKAVGAIGPGLLVYLGVAKEDGPADVEYITTKIRDLRVFENQDGRMDLPLGEVGGGVLVVSQFTLYGDCRKGRRPSFDGAAPPAIARRLYDDVVRALRETGLTVETGSFQARMAVDMVNDGPVTLLLDSGKAF